VSVSQGCYVLLHMSVQINFQCVFRMAAISMHTWIEPCKPLVNGCIDGMLFVAMPSTYQALSHFVSVSI